MRSCSTDTGSAQEKKKWLGGGDSRGTGTEQATQEVKGYLMGNVAWTFPGQEDTRTGPCFLWEQTCEGAGLG